VAFLRRTGDSGLKYEAKRSIITTVGLKVLMIVVILHNTFLDIIFDQCHHYSSFKPQEADLFC
jgi:hypothetical protein